ncbi:hypothetical protein ACPPVV_11680 [Rhodanobacter sp. Col0626]|uniref:hypothetical protein n=1 Tax=Rhodanobacter sp. Col0626 TaxID=3415679 RepID=UPI003CF19D57
MKSILVRSALLLVCSTAPLLTLAQPMPPAGAGEAAGLSLGSLGPSQRIEGLWDEQVEQVDCRSGAPIQSIGRGTNLFMRGGALVATNNAPPTVMGVTLGQWSGNGNRFHSRMRLNLFQPPLETFAGFREMKRDITLSAHGNTLAGVVSVQDYFPEGSPKGAPFCARENGVRIAAP